MKPAARVAALAVLTVLAFGSCRPSSPLASKAATAPEPARQPSVTLPDGTVITVEVALTPEDQAQGLMFRSSLPVNTGMVFVFDEVRPQSFWMKNCHFPLDMIYTRSDGTVVDVIENVPPCRADPCPSYPSRAPADTVFEVNAGVARAHKVEVGSKLRYTGIPGR